MAPEHQKLPFVKKFRASVLVSVEIVLNSKVAFPMPQWLSYVVLMRGRPIAFISKRAEDFPDIKSPESAIRAKVTCFLTKIVFWTL